MSYREKVVAEIEKELDGLAQSGFAWRANFVAHSVCGNHSEGLAESADADFWRWNTYSSVRRIVTQVINNRAGTKPETPSHQQIDLPGFEREHLQDYYVVIRDDEEIGLPVTDLTDDELEEKARLYRKMGRTCFAHADELDRFRSWRRVLVQAAE